MKLHLKRTLVITGVALGLGLVGAANSSEYSGNIFTQVQDHENRITTLEQTQPTPSPSIMPQSSSEPTGSTLSPETVQTTSPSPNVTPTPSPQAVTARATPNPSPNPNSGSSTVNTQIPE